METKNVMKVVAGVAVIAFAFIGLLVLIAFAMGKLGITPEYRQPTADPQNIGSTTTQVKEAVVQANADADGVTASEPATIPVPENVKKVSTDVQAVEPGGANLSVLEQKYKEFEANPTKFITIEVGHVDGSDLVRVTARQDMEFLKGLAVNQGKCAVGYHPQITKVDKTDTVEGLEQGNASITLNKGQAVDFVTECPVEEIKRVDASVGDRGDFFVQF